MEEVVPGLDEPVEHARDMRHDGEFEQRLPAVAEAVSQSERLAPGLAVDKQPFRARARALHVRGDVERGDRLRRTRLQDARAIRPRDAVGEMKRVQVDDAKQRRIAAVIAVSGGAPVRPESAKHQHAGEGEFHVSVPGVGEAPRGAAQGEADFTSSRTGAPLRQAQGRLFDTPRWARPLPPPCRHPGLVPGPRPAPDTDPGPAPDTDPGTTRAGLRAPALDPGTSPG